MTLPEEQSAIDPVELKRKRQVRRQIIYPFMLGIALMVFMMLLTIPLRQSDLGAIADLMISCLCFFPIAICMFPVYMIVVLSAIYMGKGNQALGKQFGRARVFSGQMVKRSEDISDTINEHVIDLSEKVAKLDVIFDIFEEKENLDNTQDNQQANSGKVVGENNHDSESRQ